MLWPEPGPLLGLDSGCGVSPTSPSLPSPHQVTVIIPMRRPALQVIQELMGDLHRKFCSCLSSVTALCSVAWMCGRGRRPEHCSAQGLWPKHKKEVTGVVVWGGRRFFPRLCAGEPAPSPPPLVACWDSVAEGGSHGSSWDRGLCEASSVVLRRHLHSGPCPKPCAIHETVPWFASETLVL